MELESQHPPQVEERGPQLEERAIHPFLRVAQAKFVEQYPTHQETIKAVVKEIANQGHENWTDFHSEIYTDVSFPYSKITLNEKFVKKVAGVKEFGQAVREQNSQTAEKNNAATSLEYKIIIPASAPPNDSHPFTASDVILERVTRDLVRIANAMGDGRPVPQIEIILPGMPDGMGGHITKKFFNSIDRYGFVPYGKLFSEFLKKTLPGDIASSNNIHIEFFSYSQGAPITSEIIDQLPQELRDKSQALHDNPAGDHEPTILTSTIKGGQTVVGLFGEIVGRTFGDQFTKDMNQYATEFRNYLIEKHNIPRDSKSQASLKLATFATKSLWLMKGYPINTEGFRHHIRQSKYDPVSTGPGRFIRNFKANGKARSQGFEETQMAAKDRGRSFTALTDNGTHFLSIQHYDKWNNRFNFIKNKIKTTNLSQPEAE